MIKNYIKIAFRSLLKNKGYSFLNIFGLAIGITCASLIFLWVEDEMSFNTVFEKQDEVYYVPTNQQYEGEWRTFYSTPGPLAKVLKDEIPGVVRAAKTFNESFTFAVGDNTISRRGLYADTDIIEIFGLKFIEGNAKEALKKPEAIIITKEIAEQLYGKDKTVLGKTLKINNTDNYVITGVIENIPDNVSFPFKWIAPFNRFGANREWTQEYGSNFADTFVELSPEANFETVDAQVRKIYQAKTGDNETYAWLHTIKNWHLKSKFEDGKVIGGRITYVRLFIVIALIILLIACINFMNLATARSEKRANEVGVRKAMGSGRSRLMFQFIAEALLMSSIATVVSVLLLFILLPQFNLLIDKNLVLGLSNPLHVSVLLIITLVCGLFAGLYPAFYLSSFKPVEVLKGIKATAGSAIFIRKGLVVGQFTISIVFIISTILVYQQIQHVKNRDLGYNKEQLIRLDVNGDMIENFAVIEQDLINSGVAESAAFNNSKLLSGGNNGSGLKWQGGTNTEDILISFRYVSPKFLKTTNIKLIEGRDFSANTAADSTRTIITESLAKLMGEGSAIGKTIRRGDDTYQVTGVVKDFLYGNMYTKSDPVMFFNAPENARYLYIKTIAGIETSTMLSKIEAIMKKNNPAFPFEYTFVDEAFNNKFKSEQLVGKLSQIFAVLAILISCLGLFGLAAYTAEQRRKEIGVRKVLGASVPTIVKLLSKDFIKLVLISIIIAAPIAWLLMSNWLEDYAYRIEINWWIFIVAGIIAIIIALITVSFQAIKAAITNPVNSLKTE
ncbi:ABC transporter permease [Pontimicrobium sp. MEBiC01747]